MKKFYILIVLLIIVGGLFYFEKTSHAPSQDKFITENNTINVSFYFSDEEPVTKTYEYSSTSLNLIEITQNIAQQNDWIFETEDYGELGVLVTNIKDKNNGQDNKYWQYFVNDKQPQISANKYFPSNNETIEWKFQESEF